jgi:hypothetical protein
MKVQQDQNLITAWFCLACLLTSFAEPAFALGVPATLI